MEQLIVEIAKLGTGWAAAAYMFKLLLSEKDKRLEDSNRVNNVMIEPLKKIQETLDLILQLGIKIRSKKK